MGSTSNPLATGAAYRVPAVTLLFTTKAAELLSLAAFSTLSQPSRWC